MTKAFWTIRDAVQIDGEWLPNLPALGSGMTVVTPGDIFILRAGSGAANHRHTILGSFALPSWNVASKHTHYILRRGAFYQQAIIHETQADHQHPDPLAPDYLMCFIRCSDADYATLLAAPYNVRVMAEAEIATDEDGEHIGALDNTAWTAPQRTVWVNLALSALGLNLPPEIDRGARLVAFLLDMFRARRDDNERGLR